MTTRVLLVRPDRNEADARALSARGLDPQIDPYLQVMPVEDPSGGTELLEAVRTGGAGDWLIATSPRAWPAWASLVGAEELDDVVRAAARRGLRGAAVGPASVRSLPSELDVLVPARATSADLLIEMSSLTPGRALLPLSTIARRDLVDGLSARGWHVLARAVYGTRRVERPASVNALVEGQFGVVVLRSPSAVDAVLAHPVPDDVLLVAVGPVTTAAVQAHGRRCATLVSTDPDDVAAAVAVAAQG